MCYLLALGAAIPDARALDGAIGRSTGMALPRFASLAKEESYVRVGPGSRYPRQWTYHRRGLPVRIVDEHYAWRQIEDSDGDRGWVHRSQLSGTRTVLVQNGIQTLYRAPVDEGEGLLRAEANVIARLEQCDEGWCQVVIDGVDGWMPRAVLWGIDP
ncbi:MAG: SH3 domain-containing protein [Geminicoccaceae bacterium]